MAYSSEEFRELLRSLELYADEELDQWETLRVTSAYGPVYIYIGREPPAGLPTDLFHQVSSGPPPQDESSGLQPP